MNKNLLIIGAGQYGMIAKEVAESMGVFERIDFLDDNNEIAIGKIKDYENFVCDYSYAFVAIGDNAFRLEMIEKLQGACYQIAILVSSKSFVSPSAQLRKGTIVEPMAVVQANASVAIGCLVCSGAVVKHNAFVGDGCYLDCNGVVQAGVLVPARTKVDANTVYTIEDATTALQSMVKEG